MRTTITATTLLLAATALPVLATAPANAASTCAEATTTWVGPTGGGSNDWDLDANWSGGVPQAADIVCITHGVPATAPRVPDGSAAQAAEVVLAGLIDVEGSLTTGLLATTTGTLTGGGQVVATDGGTIEGAVTVTGGTTLLLQGDTVLHGDVQAQHGDDGPGMLEIARNAELTLDDESASVSITGPLRNNGIIDVDAGELTVFGTGTGLEADGLSTGAFMGWPQPEAVLRLDGVNFGDGAVVGEATVSSTILAEDVHIYLGTSIVTSAATDVPALSGAGTVELFYDSVVNGPIEGSVGLVVPAGETASLGEATLSDTVRLDVEGELRQPPGSELILEDDATMHVSGVHRLVEADGSGSGTEIVEPGGLVSATGSENASAISYPLVNHGTVEADDTMFVLAAEQPATEPSTGTFVAHDDASIHLIGGSMAQGSVLRGYITNHGPLELDGTRVDGSLTNHVSQAYQGSLQITDAILGDGGSIGGEGELVIDGVLRADPGAGGAASVSGAEVTGTLRAESGTLEVTDLAEVSLHDGILDGGRYIAADGATLGLPAVTTNRADLVLGGPTASFGDGFDGLEGIDPVGSLDLRNGADLATSGDFANLGRLLLSPGSRFSVAGDYRQGAAAYLVTGVRASGRGMLDVLGRRHLRGTLEIRRVADYRPPVGSRFQVVKAGYPGRSKFTQLMWTSFGNRSFVADYLDDGRVRLEVVKG